MQKLSRSIAQRAAKPTTAMFASQSTNQFSEQPARRAQLTMASEESKHRVKLPLYDLRPRTENCWVAPNSTIGKKSSNCCLNFLLCK